MTNTSVGHGYLPARNGGLRSEPNRDGGGGGGGGACQGPSHRDLEDAGPSNGQIAGAAWKHCVRRGSPGRRSRRCVCVSNKVIRSRCGWRVCAASCKESLVLGTGVEGVRRMEEGGAGHHPLPRVPDFLARALGQDRPSKRASPGACLALLETSATGNYRRESTDASASAAEATTYTNDGLSEEVGNLERANKHGEGKD